MQIKITELMNAFHDGLCLMIPIFERVGLKWKAEESYDPWENLASVLFTSIVESAVENGIYDGPIHKLSGYDSVLKSFSRNSYVAEFGTKGLTTFLYFTTDLTPLDTCVFATISESGTVHGTYTKKVSDVAFSLIARRLDGSAITEISDLKFLD